MKNIDMRQLAMLCTLVECQSSAETARRMDITPSAVSQNLARLREIMGDPMCVRENNGYQLTPFGERAIGDFAEIIALWNGLSEKDSSFEADKSDARLAFACYDAFGEAVLWDFYRALMSEAPYMTLDLLAGNGEAQDVHGLRTGRLDLLVGPMGDRSGGSDLCTENIGQYQISHCCLSATHPRIGRSVSLAQYMAESHLRVCVAPSGGDESDPLDAALLRTGLTERRCSTLNSWELCADLLAESDRLVSVTHVQAQALMRADPRITSLPLPPGPTWPTLPLQMVWHERNTHNAAHRWARNRLSRIFLDRPAAKPRMASAKSDNPVPRVMAHMATMANIALVASNG